MLDEKSIFFWGGGNIKKKNPIKAFVGQTLLLHFGDIYTAADSDQRLHYPKTWIPQTWGSYRISGPQFPFPLADCVSGELPTKPSSCCLTVWYSEVMAIKWDCVNRCWLHLEFKLAGAGWRGTTQTGNKLQRSAEDQFLFTIYVFFYNL